MALNFPSSPTNGQTYTDPNSVFWRYDGEKWNVVLGTASKIYSGVKVKLSSNAALVASNTSISFDSEEFDTDNYFNLSTPQKILFNQTGYYRVNLSAFTSTSGSLYGVALKKNSNTVITSTVINPNQNANYDEILEFNANDYIEVVCSEASSTGAITTDTVLEVTRIGLTLGTGIRDIDAFSGARAILSTGFSTTSTPSAVIWDSTIFNTNADALGNTYWNVSDPTKLIIRLSGYYRIKSFIESSSADNYVIVLKKNNSANLSSASIGPSSVIQIDEIYNFTANDYIQIVVNDSNSSGQLTTNTYAEIVRIGI